MMDWTTTALFVLPVAAWVTGWLAGEKQGHGRGYAEAMRNLDRVERLRRQEGAPSKPGVVATHWRVLDAEGEAVEW